MKAIKKNKVYTIDESQKKFYTDSGFDIIDEDGKVIAYGKGKTVPYEQYAALQAEVAELKEKGSDAAIITVLQEYCSDHAIDVGRATTVSGILKKIDEAKASAGGQ